jgi:adenosylcobinamide-GDP ribazoletransferase
LKFLVALKYLTTIPVPFHRELSPRDLGDSSLFFSLVGLLIGLFLAALGWLLRIIFPGMLVDVLVIGALVAVSGARQLDGIAHTADSLVVGASRETRLEIMADRRVGSFGIIAVATLLLLKYVALDSLPQGLWLPTLVYMPVLGRWAMVYAIFFFRSALPSSQDGDFKQGTRWYSLLLATIIAIAVTFALARLPGLMVMAGVLIVATILGLYFRQRFGGLTVAAYGAVCEFAELAVLVIVSLLAHVGLA